jgi:spore coat polysaccharide biosynthesis protein SpsF (cytidylyltransferase family)
MKNKVHVVLQARTGSSRLYGKVLLPILGVPLVVLCWRRLKLSNLDVVVIIPKGPEDDFLAKILKKNKIKYFRGSTNVLCFLYINKSNIDLKHFIFIIINF